MKTWTEANFKELEQSRCRIQKLQGQLSATGAIRAQAESVPILQEQLQMQEARYAILKTAIMDVLTGTGTKRLLAFALECSEDWAEDLGSLGLAMSLYQSEAAKFAERTSVTDAHKQPHAPVGVDSVSIEGSTTETARL